MENPAGYCDFSCCLEGFHRSLPENGKPCGVLRLKQSTYFFECIPFLKMENPAGYCDLSLVIAPLSSTSS